jgi:hypothetical protein
MNKMEQAYYKALDAKRKLLMAKVAEAVARHDPVAVLRAELLEYTHGLMRMEVADMNRLKLTPGMRV